MCFKLTTKSKWKDFKLQQGSYQAFVFSVWIIVLSVLILFPLSVFLHLINVPSSSRTATLLKSI